MNPYNHYQFSGHSSSASGFSSFLGAFSGAFFAFIFGLITYVITKRRERFVQHKNAVIKLERVLNKHLDDLGVLDKLCKDSIRILTTGKVTSNRLIKLQMPEGIDMELGSIDLVNKFFSYQISVDRFNFNVTTTNYALTRLEDLFINGQPVLTANYDFIIGTLNNFVADLPKFNERVLKLLTLIRIHQNKIKNKNTFIYGAIHTHWEQDISEEDVRKERDKLDDEIRQIMARAPDDIF